MTNIAGIFGLLMAILAILWGVWTIYWAFQVSSVWDPWTQQYISGGLALASVIIGIVFIVFFILGILFFMQCKTINDMVDRGQYVQAKSKTLVWMIIGIIFVFFIPGILLLIAYLKFDPLIRSTQPQYYPPPPQQPYQQPPPQQPPQQYPPQQQPPPQQPPQQ
jgi:heme/copper-type cytochrome/quinol oxidase subunit 2